MTKRKRSRIIYKTVAEINAMPRMCTWAGCEEAYQGDMPPDWNNLLVFWAPGPILNIAEINPHFWPRDGVLCPKHCAALEQLLKPDEGCITLREGSR